MDLMIMIAIIVLMKIVEHYIPWRKIFRGQILPNLAKHFLGVMTIIIPLSCFHLKIYLLENSISSLNAILFLWIAVCSSGLTIFLIWLIEGWRNSAQEAEEGEERENALMGVLNAQDDKFPRK